MWIRPILHWLGIVRLYQFVPILISRFLSQELHYVDKSKIALVGEDEGGYTAGMVYSADMEARVTAIDMA